MKFEFPYDKGSFRDRYTRQHRNRPCSTIVAHLAKDGLMFIHPTQNRSLTPREAARVQTFPDWFVFPEHRTHSFRLIGNAVPPLIGEAAGAALLRFLRPCAVAGPITEARTLGLGLPSSRAEAADWLEPLTRADRKAMRTLPKAAFLKCWHAVLWLFPDLHPENALEHGSDEHDEPASGEAVDRFRRRYTRSGWPIVLECLGKEAWRRFEADELSDEEFYCVDAQRAGLEARMRAEPPSLAPSDPALAISIY
jgi:DNA (cytosine-5)-methyltransferase 1